jgi:uncharacterized membrane protein YqjE
MKLQAHSRSVMTTQHWFLTILVTMLVPLGLIMLFIWVFNPSTNENKANYAKAVLLFYGMLLIVYLGYMVIFGIAIFNSFSSI